VSRRGQMGYAPPFTYRITHRASGGHHGEGSDAQQQRKEEAEAGQEQEERRRCALTIRRHAQPGQTRHLVHEPVRQEALAGRARQRPSWRRPTNVRDPENAEDQILTENAPSKPCSISRIKSGFLIQLDMPFGFGGMIALWSGRSL